MPTTEEKQLKIPSWFPQKYLNDPLVLKHQEIWKAFKKINIDMIGHEMIDLNQIFRDANDHGMYAEDMNLNKNNRDNWVEMVCNNIEGCSATVNKVKTLEARRIVNMGKIYDSLCKKSGKQSADEIITIIKEFEKMCYDWVFDNEIRDHDITYAYYVKEYMKITSYE